MHLLLSYFICLLYPLNFLTVLFPIDFLNPFSLPRFILYSLATCLWYFLSLLYIYTFTFHCLLYFFFFSLLLSFLSTFSFLFLLFFTFSTFSLNFLTLLYHFNFVILLPYSSLFHSSFSVCFLSQISHFTLSLQFIFLHLYSTFSLNFSPTSSLYFLFIFLCHFLPLLRHFTFSIHFFSQISDSTFSLTRSIVSLYFSYFLTFFLLFLNFLILCHNFLILRHLYLGGLFFPTFSLCFLPQVFNSSFTLSIITLVSLYSFSKVLTLLLFIYFSQLPYSTVWLDFRSVRSIYIFPLHSLPLSPLPLNSHLLSSSIFSFHFLSPLLYFLIQFLFIVESTKHSMVTIMKEWNCDYILFLHPFYSLFYYSPIHSIHVKKMLP